MQILYVMHITEDPTRREEYWRRVLKTVSPYGLNTVVQRSHILARLLYILTRQGCYYRKMFNLVNNTICMEESSGEGSYHTETSRFICFAKRLAGFRMVLVFTGRYFRAEYNLIVLSVNYCQQCLQLFQVNLQFIVATKCVLKLIINVT